MYFSTCGLYIQSCTTLTAKINAIELVIQALENQALTAASPGAGSLGGSLSEYKLNDGQTIISEVYRGPAAIAAAITSFETIKQRYINRLNGRVFRGMDSKNFGHGPYW